MVSFTSVQSRDSSRRTAYGYDERIEVFGSAGAAESRRQQPRSMSLYRGDKVIVDNIIKLRPGAAVAPHAPGEGPGAPSGKAGAGAAPAAAPAKKD